MCYNDAMKREPGPFADGAQPANTVLYNNKARSKYSIMVVKCNVWCKETLQVIDVYLIHTLFQVLKYS